MSTYSYTVEFDDGEIMMIESALLSMIEKCEQEILIEARAPFVAFKFYAENVLKRLHGDVKQMSFNNFNPKKNKHHS